SSLTPDAQAAPWWCCSVWPRRSAPITSTCRSYLASCSSVLLPFRWSDRCQTLIRSSLRPPHRDERGELFQYVLFQVCDVCALVSLFPPLVASGSALTPD